MSITTYNSPARATGRGANLIGDAELGSLTLSGVLLFFTGLFVFGSGFGDLRPEIGGLLVHPCLFPILISAPFLAFSRLGQFPSRILAGLLVFTCMYSISAMGQSVALGEIAKCGSALVMIVVAALLVRTRADFVAGVVGLTVAIGLLAFRALQTSDLSAEGGAIDVANKNSFSIYALSAILLAGAVVLQFKTLTWLLKVPLMFCGLVAVVSILLSGNRSGWLGVAVVGVLLMKDRKFAGTLLVLVLTSVAAFWISNYGDTRVAEQRIKDTQQGRTSDTFRINLFRNSLMIGLENPLLGVSPQRLPFELGLRVTESTAYNVIDPHNVWGHVAGGSGLICFAALLYSGWAIWRWPMAKLAKKQPAGKMYVASVHTIRSMVVLWAVRGMFTREILYNPGASIGLGLAIGWCMIEYFSFAQVVGPGKRFPQFNATTQPERQPALLGSHP